MCSDSILRVRRRLIAGLLLSTLFNVSNQEGQCNWKAGPNGDLYTYDASWGVGWDVPFPELYSAYQEQNWVNVYNDYHQSQYYIFYDAITECSEADPLPTGNCYVQGNNDCEYSPTEASQTAAAYFNNSIPLTGFITNQQYEGAQQTGNGNC